MTELKELKEILMYYITLISHQQLNHKYETVTILKQTVAVIHFMSAVVFNMHLIPQQACRMLA